MYYGSVRVQATRSSRGTAFLGPVSVAPSRYANTHPIDGPLVVTRHVLLEAPQARVRAITFVSNRKRQLLHINMGTRKKEENAGIGYSTAL